MNSKRKFYSREEKVKLGNAPSSERPERGERNDFGFGEA